MPLRRPAVDLYDVHWFDRRSDLECRDCGGMTWEKATAMAMRLKLQQDVERVQIAKHADMYIFASQAF